MKRILFFHASDLFERSGTSIIYRRVLPLLPAGWHVTHVGALFRSEPNARNIEKAYEKELPRVLWLRPSFDHWAYIYLKLCTRVFGQHRYRPLVWLYGHWLRRVVRRLQPDLIWFSSDYLPLTYWLLYNLLPFLDKLQLHLSLYDPLELWKPQPTTLRRYAAILIRANSFDVIGENMRRRVTAEAPGKPVTILTDYIDHEHQMPAAFSNDYSTEIIAAIAGRIYAKEELQKLVDALSAAGLTVRIRWFGGDRDSEVASEVRWPTSIRLERMGVVPRSEVVAQITSFQFGYLSMPMSDAEFARYSLPTKLVTYAEAGIPVLFHAPLDSEVRELNQIYGFGLNLSETNTPASEISLFLENSGNYRKGICSLALDRFSRKHVQDAIHNIVNDDDR